MSSSDPSIVPLPQPPLPAACPRTRGEQITHILGITIPFASLILGIILLWNRGITWVELSLLVGMYVLTGLGVTIGYHRLFTHKSFETSAPVRFILAIIGHMSAEGSIISWVGTHRRHHQHSDRDGDPHSPHLHAGAGILAQLRGLWHAHMGWLLSSKPADLPRYVPDLLQDRLLLIADRLSALWVCLGLLIPAGLGGLLTQTWMGALLGFIWGGLVRIFLVHHATWSVNSICHLWGSRPFRSHDHSTNNLICALFSLGEGWHNNHHAFPTSARHGLRWWQLDCSWIVIRLMSILGLVWKVRVPSPQAQEAGLCS